MRCAKPTLLGERLPVSRHDSLELVFAPNLHGHSRSQVRVHDCRDYVVEWRERHGVPVVDQGVVLAVGIVVADQRVEGKKIKQAK